MRKVPTLVAAAAVAAAASAVPVTGVFGSSHREAPQIMLDPAADNTDLYAFTAPDAPDRLTIVANWIPLEDSAGGPNFGKLDPKARYHVKIDNTGDGVEDVGYHWQFTSRFRNPDSFLAYAPPVKSIDDANINFVQTYDLWKDRYHHGQLVGSHLVGDDLPVAPDNTGPKTFPDYPAVATAPSAGYPAAASRSSGRSTTRSSSTSARSSTASTSTSPAARASAWATRAAARTTSRATTPTRSSCRSRRARSPATGAPSPAPRRPTRSSACGRPRSAAGFRSPTGSTPTRACRTARGCRSAASATR